MATIQYSESDLRIRFFDLLFADQAGYMCIALKNPSLPQAAFSQKFFLWPDDYIKAEEYILKHKNSKDLYFCVNLLEKPDRKKEWCLPSTIIWSDLDEVDPRTIVPSPPIVIESSKNRFQALWRLSMPVDAAIAENYSKRIAYAKGADKSGWDLTQLLRVPYTFNHKYNPPQPVVLLSAAETQAAPVLFETFPAVDTGDIDIGIENLPTEDDLPTIDVIFYKFASRIRGTSFTAIFTQELSPEDDWSKPLWKIIHMCLEMGMSPEETFVVARESSVNKYDRDKRPITHLWRDVLKASAAQESISILSVNFKPLVMPTISNPDYEPDDSFVTDYRKWAEEATDAVPSFHDLSAFILLSSVVANSVRLETSYGTMVPNLWGMILGDSTLSRKTTAMRMVMDLLNSMNPDMILATDGSAEGILGGLEMRPNRTSIFFRDELSGFFDSINRKDYLAGMPETFTALYDVPSVYQRRLRKEIIRLENPVFIFFGGGVREKVYEVCKEEYVLSGFLPRFLVVSGNTDLSKLRRTGPANELGVEGRSKLVNRVADMYEKYAAESVMSIGGQKIAMPPHISAKLTPKAWDSYGRIEEIMVQAGDESAIPNLALPTFERLSRSLLKMSMILAAQRQDPTGGSILVEERDVNNAAWYVQQWGVHSIDLITNTGKGVTEKILDKIVNSVTKHPGILRSSLMQHHKLTKRDADDILNTLEDRQILQKEKKGRGYAYWVV